MTLHEWAQRHGISAASLSELSTDVLGLTPPEAPASMRFESDVQAHVRLAVSKRGDRVFRNNIGAGMLNGQFVRFGLANDSERLNTELKSSDLIGIQAGTGRFLSYECKRRGWRYTGTPREAAQLRWITLIATLGGIAKFVTGPEQIE